MESYVTGMMKKYAHKGITVDGNKFAEKDVEQVSKTLVDGQMDLTANVDGQLIGDQMYSLVCIQPEAWMAKLQERVDIEGEMESLKQDAAAAQAEMKSDIAEWRDNKAE